MTQTKTGVLLTSGRIPKLLGNVVLAAGFLAGSISLLNAGGANAAPCPSNFNFAISDIVGPQQPADVDCTSPVGGNPWVVAVDTDFLPNLVGPTGRGYSSYQIDVTVPGYYFNQARLDSDLDNDPGRVVKLIYSDPFDPFTGLPSPGSTPIVAPLISTNGMPDGPVALPGQYQTLYVLDVYRVGPGGQLDNYTDTFRAVPGPLPLLGAGAAFGFSRKLRRRIKSSQLG